MNQIAKLKQAFSSGELSKPQFIESMYQTHRVLQDYAECLPETNVASISIRADQVIVEFRDPPFTMRCPPGDMRIPPIEAFNFGDYERDETRMVRTIVDLLGGSDVHFFDIGANAGFYSLVLAACFPGIRGVAFEPIPKTFTYLQENFHANHVTGIRPVNVGLSDRAADLVFYTYPNQSAAASMSKNLADNESQKLVCEVVPLDDFLCADDVAALDFIKCDVEGAELLVFKGSLETLRAQRPAIFSEMLRKWCAQYEYHPNDLIKFFADIGYRCFVIRGSSLARIQQVTRKTVDTNFVFLHAEKHATIANKLLG